MKGRKPKPTELKLLAGNPGKRDLPEPPEYDDGDIEYPEELLHEKYELARKEWDRQAPLLKRADVFKKIDRTALMCYCIAYQNYVTASDGIRDYGYFIRTNQGHVMLNPHVKTQRLFFDQMSKLASEFGMTPSSRVRLGSFEGEENFGNDDLTKKIFG